MAVKVVIAGYAGGGVQGRSNYEEPGARCHDSTNGWPFTSMEFVTRRLCALYYVSAPKDALRYRAQLAESKLSR